jgi:hypothetical protein
MQVRISVRHDCQLLNPDYLGEVVATGFRETYWSRNRFEVTVDLDKSPKSMLWISFCLLGRSHTRLDPCTTSTFALPEQR